MHILQNIASAIHECYKKNNEPTNAELMELYSFVGQCVCKQGEKAFVVHLAWALSEQLPHIKGFSPRNLRRMRDFNCSYESRPELMQKALTLIVPVSKGISLISWLGKRSDSTKKFIFGGGGCCLTKEEFSNKLIALFPEKANALAQHYKKYGQFLGHIFFSEEINIPLCELLQSNQNPEMIKKYCNLIEEMWSCGSTEVINIVDVTIVERLSDDQEVWSCFGAYISNSFKSYINESILKENNMMTSVSRL